LPNRASLNHIYRSVWNQSLGVMVAVAEIAGACCGAASSAQAQAQTGVLPSGGVAVHGSASFNASQTNKLVVTTQNGAGTSHSAINWNSFSIGAGNTTQFVQPSASSTAINRVVTNTPSELFGTLSSNGRLVLVNQSGIAVGAGAVVDTAGFTASAVGMSEADAIAGRLRFGGSGLTASDGALTVQGNLIARGGDVVLIAPSIDLAKTAVVEAQGGSVMLVAGQGVEVTGRGLEGITLQVQAPSDKAVNLGTLKGDAIGIFAGNLKHSGMIQATTASSEGGKVVLKAVDLLDIDGEVKAAGTAGKGGVIHATADRIVLRSTAELDASGATGGGEVRIGGGWHGEDARIGNARQTVVLEGAQIKADATDRGDGGSVVVWADGATRFLGSLSARGGLSGGDGGHAEVSGKQYLDFRGAADLTASAGSLGSLLLDPNNITVGAVADVDGLGLSHDISFIGGDLLFGLFSLVNSQITAAQVGTLLNTGNLVLEANNNLDVISPISKSGAGATSLTLHASNNVTVSSPITTSGGALNITMLAAGGLAINANVNAGAGDVTLTGNSGSGISQGGGGITGATLTANSASGNVTLNGTNNVTTARFPTAGTVQFNNTAATYNLGGAGASSLTVTGTGVVTIDQPVTYPNVNISSNGGITVGANITSPLALTLTTVNNLISQSGVSHQITSGPATVNAGTFDITLGNSNDFSTLNLTGANILIKDANALNVTSLNYGAGSNVYLEAGGALTLPAGNILTTGQLSLFSGTTLATPGNLSGSTVILSGPSGLDLGHNVTATGPLFLTGGATSGVNQTAGAITAVGGLTTVSAGSSPVNLNLAGNNFSSVAVTGGAVQLRDANGFALGNVVANTLDVNSSSGSGSITQVPATTISTAFGSTFNTNGGAVNLTNTGNSLGSFQTTSTNAGAVNLTNNGSPLSLNLTNAGLLNLQSAGNVNINNTVTTTGAINITSTSGSISQNYMAPINAGGTIKLRASTGLTVAGSLNASAGGDSIVLASTTGLLNATGASVSMGGGGRWLTYLDDPAAAHSFDIFQPVASPDFRQYGAPYGTTPLGTGNGTLFTVAPVLSGTLTGTVTKTYDGTTSIGMSGAVLSSVSGYMFGDLGGSISSAGTLASPNVGSGILVTVSGGTVTGVTDTDTFTTSYGYKINASGSIGIVTPAAVRPVSTIGLSGARPYNGTNIVNASIFSLSGLVGSETLSLSGSGTVADKNVGINKPVSLGSLALGDGSGLASNYTLSGGAHVATITPAAITGVSGITANNKVYDGTTAATLVTSGAVLSGLFGGDRVTVSGATGAFADRNAGSAKPVTVTGLALTGTDAVNYTLSTTTASAGKADIAVRPLSTWTGAGGGAWSSPSNWDALPDGNNVLAVSIPAGTGAITFDSSVGLVNLQALSSSRPLVITGGAVTVGSNLAIPSLSLSAGSLTGGGGLNISSALSQTGGSIVMAGNVVANQTAGDLVVGTMSAPSIALTAPAGAIAQTGPLTTAALQTTSTAGTSLGNAGNKISSFTAGNTGVGNIVLNNGVPVDIKSAINTAGDFSINNIGAVTFNDKAVVVINGKLTAVANSPLTVGTGGITAGGDISLTATNLTSEGNMTLNGPVTSDGQVSLVAANNMVQNGSVFGAKGVFASAGGSIVFGPLATSGKSPVVYSSGSAPVSPPIPPTSKSASAGDVIVTFLNLFEKAVENQKDEIFITRSDGTTRRKTTADAITSEGEICRP